MSHERQQVFVLFVTHDRKHEQMAVEIQRMVRQMPGVHDAGVLVSDSQGGTLLRDASGQTRKMLPEIWGSNR